MNLPGWLEVIIRSLSILIVLFILTKIRGKKQISQLSLFEYIIGITIGDISAETSVGVKSNFFYGVSSLLVWTVIPLIISFSTLKNKKVREVLEGKATVVIKDGKIQEDTLNKEKYSIDNIMELLRQKNAFNIADVEFAVLEPSGDLSVLMKKESQPLTPKDIQMKVPSEKEPQTVIMEGKILDEPLGLTGYNRAWLEAELQKLNVALDNIVVGQIDSYGKLTVDIFDDKIQIPKSQERALLLATIKKCQADMELFTLATESKEAQQMYKKNAERLAHMIKRVEYLLNE
ncbi:hypothetical protein AN964_10355 [Heyndrickxia shackletonii]|uniref:YetF C-terminal domain-containing protein n=1 Tax=Heyndrickxia shackletonii TaxID=157838 RepID=A0A0Q3WXV7_9BACI|nr:DUF421 domain-containing protein [Heyndrickxia shackletonii]KQL53860.1 hypothetical protein AN964_10355 [Heyndrickxia shackletonii]NEY97867.1 DUF421 domain-containing protein [Heyndrickxia shackletonii]